MIKFCEKCYQLAYTRIYGYGLPNAKICYSKECAVGKKAKNRPRVLWRPKSIQNPEYRV